MYKKNCFIWFVLVSCIFTCCNSNKNPYENNLGIEPEVIAQMDTANYTTIFWPDSVKNIGTIKTTDTAHIQFHFTNTGNKPLFIITVAPACGCTIASFSKEPVQPGKQGVVNAVYKWNGQIGELRKTISVETNSRNGRSHTLVFYGKIIKDSVITTTK